MWPRQFYNKLRRYSQNNFQDLDQYQEVTLLYTYEETHILGRSILFQ